MIERTERLPSANSPSKLSLFMRNFFRHPAMLGSLIPSSPFLVEDILAGIDWAKARVIVEYGPGVGTITERILSRMRPDATLVAIDANEDFANFLREEIPDPRLRVFHGSAEHVAEYLAQLGLKKADYIISGIPYSMLPDSVRRGIMERSRALLDPHGTLIVYQFTNTVRPYLQSSFGSVREGFQPLNVLPARIFHCTI
jgi:phospholipid N-methyltransferase